MARRLYETPLGFTAFFAFLTQGSRCAATLGYPTKALRASTSSTSFMPVEFWKHSASIGTVVRHVMLGIILNQERRPDDSIQEFRAAAELDPNDFDAALWLCKYAGSYHKTPPRP